ncbi:MAG: hypothetical protein ACD_75C01168G0005, partial [uncultured bacterium]
NFFEFNDEGEKGILGQPPSRTHPITALLYRLRQENSTYQW